MLENSIKYYQEYIQQTKNTLLQHKQSIAELKASIRGDRQDLRLDSFRQIITQQLGEKELTGGEEAMLNLMK
jgi:hypothetical protein